MSADTIPALLRARAETSPESVAFWHQSDDTWTPASWNEFLSKVDRLASSLAHHGLEPGTHIGLLAPTCLDWEIAHHAVLAAGGVIVGLEPHDTAQRLHWIIDHADISILIVQDRTLFDRIASQGALKLRMIVFMDDEAVIESAHETRLIDLTRLETDAVSLPSVRPDAAATIIYTSGTTGQPKGILYRHDQVVLAIRGICSAYPSISVGSRFICWLPLSNLFQRIMNLAAMHVGGAVHLVGNPLEVLKALPAAKPDIFIGVPRFFEKLHEGMRKDIDKKPWPVRHMINSAINLALNVSRAREAGEAASLAKRCLLQFADHVVLSKLRSVMGGRIKFMITGSAPTPVRLLEFFHAIGLPLYEAYGMSENVVPMALNRPGESRLGTVGKALSANQIKIDDDGELLVRGAGVFAGYYKDERSDIFTGEGFYRTGDYGSVDAQGFWTLGGRKSEIVKTSTGRRISPIPVEEVLTTVRGVERTLVVGNGRKCLSAIVTLDATRRHIAESHQNAGFRGELLNAIQKLPVPQRPGGFLILDFGFSIEGGELTPNLKLRRHLIEKSLTEALDRLYIAIEQATNDRLPILIWHSSVLKSDPIVS